MKTEKIPYGGKYATDPNAPTVLNAYMSRIGRRGGLATSAKKAAAARRNSKKGGRPPDTYQELRVPASVASTGPRRRKV
jgi:hypothetical protein